MIDLAELRRTAGVTQLQVAQRLGMTQGNVSRFEHQSDMLLSTLATYLEAIGAEARITIRVGKTTLVHDLTEGAQ